MPCDSSHMEQNDKEKKLQEIAQLFKFVFEEGGTEVLKELYTPWIWDYYCSKDYVSTLCSILTLSKIQFDKLNKLQLGFGLRAVQARKLMNWYERHKQADRCVR